MVAIVCDCVHNVVMANVTVVPDKTTLKNYLAKGLTQAQVVDAWEKDSGNRVSRSAIAMAIERYGLKSNNPRVRHEDLLPWHVEMQHRHLSDARNLRSLGRKKQGRQLSENDAQRLEAWLQRLTEANAVVRYDADTEEGFFWVPRLPEHGDDVIDRTNVA